MNDKNEIHFMRLVTQKLTEGNISKTDEAEKEGIVEAAWYTKARLVGEVVFPPPLI
jgi:hypothetical protein